MPCGLTAGTTLDTASSRLCRQRREWQGVSGIWCFRRRLPSEKQRTQDSITAPTYRFDLPTRIVKAKGERLFHLRCMDDILVLAPTRWKLRRAIVGISQSLTQLQLTKRTDKTRIGPVSRGFDFQGYQHPRDHWESWLLKSAAQTLAGFEGKRLRLSEQMRCVSVKRRATLEVRLAAYKRRWLSWLTGGVVGVAFISEPLGHANRRILRAGGFSG